MMGLSGKRVLVTGAAGFLGSHLTDRLLAEGVIVTGVDNLISGSKKNLDEALKLPNFTYIEADVCEPTDNYLEKAARFEGIYHLASPASPAAYQHNPVATYKVNAFGTHYLLEYASAIGARLVFASTSEAYGDPQEHPQKETYWGNVNPNGPRACYDEAKRFGEMACTTFFRQYQTPVRIVRIFNTYGPRMDPEDGRMIPTFIRQALKNEPVTVFGTGQQTRSLCYVDDLVEYLIRAMKTDAIDGEVINIGNPEELTVLEIAQKIINSCHSQSQISFLDIPEDDPQRRCPDITKAINKFGYQPQISLAEGLGRTIQWYQNRG